LIGLAGMDAASRWLHEALNAGGQDEESWLKKNALLVHQRLGELAMRRGEVVAPTVFLNFAHQDLRGRDFAKQDLRGANFREADLTEAILTQADLRGANLIGAVLAGANLM